MRRASPVTRFYDDLKYTISELGGMHNAHLHLDRAGTLDERYMSSAGHRIMDSSHISLKKKHSLISVLHECGAYEEQDLRLRINDCLDIMVDCNTRRADSLVDVTADGVELSALRIMRDVQRARCGDIELRIGAYSPLGFRDDEPRGWEVFEEGAVEADFVAALPEADDTDDYPGHIGFEEHCRRVLDIARRRQCMVHVHTDQRNEPTESGTERLLSVLRREGGPSGERGEPLVWVVHMISPSTYDDARFQRLVDGLLECRVGVICCPSAALGMRQLRPVLTPTYNSIPRVLELLVAGVPIRLASDNIADICSPSTTADLVDEVFTLSAAIRFYNVRVLAKLAAGRELDQADRDLIQAHLEKDRSEVQKALGETR